MIDGRHATGVSAAVLLLSGVTLMGQQPPSPIRDEVRASHGVVAGGRTFTVEAGARVMSAGGNAIDGGVASIFAAAVVEISHFGLGGEAPIIIYSARDRHVVVVNGQGSAPKAAGPQLFAGKDAIPGNGPLGATLPAAVDAASIALAKYGTKSLGDVLQPAIALADGFPMNEFLHHYLETERAACEPYAWTMKTYYPGGTITPVGATFRQPSLPVTLRALAAAEQAAHARGASREQAIEAGRDAFYKGPIARDMTAAVREAGRVMTEEDLAGCHGPDRGAGDSQDQQILLVLLNSLDFGMDVQAAIEAPPVNSLHPVSSFDDHRPQPGVLEVESTLAPAVLDELNPRGHVLLVRRPFGISTGIVLAGVDPITGRLRGGADLRRERAIVAW